MAGASVIGGIDMDPWAVKCFGRAHPTALSIQGSVTDIRLTAKFSDVDLLLASPPCQDHSQAKHGERDPVRQDLPWAVLPWIEALHPRWVIVENVPQLTAWTGWQQWVRTIIREGYQVCPVVLNSVQFGVPQIRKRLFAIFWQRDQQAVWFHPPAVWRVHPAAEILDPPERWPLRAMEETTAFQQRRCRTGWDLLGNPDRFLLLPFTEKFNGGRYVRSFDKPLMTLTTQVSHFAVVECSSLGPEGMRGLCGPEVARGMGWPHEPPWLDECSRTVQKRLLGNAVCPPVAAAIVERLITDSGG